MYTLFLQPISLDAFVLNSICDACDKDDDTFMLLDMFRLVESNVLMSLSESYQLLFY